MAPNTLTLAETGIVIGGVSTDSVGTRGRISLESMQSLRSWVIVETMAVRKSNGWGTSCVHW